MGSPHLRREDEYRFWEEVRAGQLVSEAAESAGVSESSGQRWFRKSGGVSPKRTRSGRVRPRLTLAQREEIAVLRAAGASNAEVAREIGCHRSTVGRELRNNSRAWIERGKIRRDYRASSAQSRSDWRARRPKESKLAESDRLRAEVQSRLEEEHSPEQISARLEKDLPNDEEMRVSHETIYRALYVQGRGGLRRDLHKRLRTGRAMRKPRRKTGQRAGRIPNMVSIAERPKEADERAVPGHWEGDLIVGKQSKSAIGTLVERVTGFVMLLHLPDSHGADQVEAAMAQAMSRLPETLRRTLTWDQGKELANHAEIAAATELEIYFCDPHSPWQRPVNENTNGLLRQYFPKGVDLSVFAADYLDHVATKLNNRPRKRLDWSTPGEALDELLSNPPKQADVASTG